MKIYHGDRQQKKLLFDDLGWMKGNAFRSLHSCTADVLRVTCFCFLLLHLSCSQVISLIASLSQTRPLSSSACRKVERPSSNLASHTRIPKPTARQSNRRIRLPSRAGPPTSSSALKWSRLRDHRALPSPSYSWVTTTRSINSGSRTCARSRRSTAPTDSSSSTCPPRRGPCSPSRATSTACRTSLSSLPPPPTSASSTWPRPHRRSSTASRSRGSRVRGASCRTTCATSSRASGPRRTSPWRWGSASPPPRWSRAWRT